MDSKIFKLLLSTPTITQKEIAKALGVTPPAITSRIKKMKKNGIIKGFTPVLDLHKMGFEINTFMMVWVKNGKLNEAANFFAGDDNVCSVYSVCGNYDLAVIAKFKNSSEADKWNRKIAEKTSLIYRTQTSQMVNTVRESLAPNEIQAQGGE